MSEAKARADVTPADEIKRTSGPQTTNGRQWQVQLNGTPSPAWLAIFKEFSARILPQRVEFDRAAALFKSDESGVEQWVESIDKWIASTNARHVTNLEQVWRERSDRADAETRETERIQRLNDRFKNL